MVNSVETTGLFDGPFTKLMKQIYIIASSKQLEQELNIPIELTPYIETVYRAFDSPFKIHDTKMSFEPYQLNEHDPRCICAFSGGKDSLANILMLKDLGYEPIAFFVKGINYQYGYEQAIAKKLAEKLNIPFVERRVIVHGKNEYPENPVKDQLIMAMMLDYGLKLGISNYSFGIYIDSTSEGTSKEYMLSDASDMFDTFQEFVNYIYPEVDFPYFLVESVQALKIILDLRRDLLDDVCSCMAPMRFKKSYVDNAEKKYGVKLLPNRCPSCYKCCLEAIQLNIFGITDYPDRYINHCKDIMLKWYAKYMDRESLEDRQRTRDEDESWVPRYWLKHHY